MPKPSLGAPGVYLTEAPSGNRTVTGVTTAVTAFVGRALRGPVDEPVTLTSLAQFDQVFGGLWRESALGYAVRDFYLNGGGTARVVRLAGGATPARLDVNGLRLIASGPGSWANHLTVEVSHPEGRDAHEVALNETIDGGDLFHLEIRDTRPGSTDVPEVFLNVTLVDGPRRVDRILAESRLVRVEGMPEGITRPSAGTYDTGAGKGDDGHDLGLADYLGGEGANFEADGRGLHALRRADLFNLLCLPPSRPDGTLPADIWSEALALCTARRAFLLVDPPAAQPPGGFPQWLAGLGLAGESLRNAATYLPRIRRSDPLRDGAIGEFVPCGALAGVMARTDASRGVWKAPAGLDAGIVGATGLEQVMGDGESAHLNPLGINCLRAFPQAGVVVWGARTLRGADTLADDYKYVPVRRFALFLEESLYRGTQWVVFEPNDEQLWSQIRTSLGSFMQDLFRQGAFQGRTPREAYFVACDAETTTQYDIDRGVVNILVGFAPLKPAEFVVISVQQKTAAAVG
ncbi:phage tail sheath family protein [Streptomyces sp. NPDC059875]|uniref:phage tail sheath family protein n=1 Tax=unclassified Streptomyces TaxID=2593676 RepID=UPI00364780FD